MSYNETNYSRIIQSMLQIAVPEQIEKYFRYLTESKDTVVRAASAACIGSAGVGSADTWGRLFQAATQEHEAFVSKQILFAMCNVDPKRSRIQFRSCLRTAKDTEGYVDALIAMLDILGYVGEQKDLFLVREFISSEEYSVSSAASLAAFKIVQRYLSYCSVIKNPSWLVRRSEPWIISIRSAE